jgi:predicted ATPase/DNA-binding CsgD family transcriptional regulator
MPSHLADNPSGSYRLPVQSTPLVGREAEIAQVQEILNWPDVPLLTLTGPGGVGKTRLALEVSERLAGQFADGVVFVPLALVQDADQVLPTLAKALGLRESGRSTVEVVQEFLRGRQMLLVLDNFEHVLDAASVISELIHATHDVTILVTSRSRLRLYGEHEFNVPPLALPTPENPEGEAVRLFLERVRAVQPGFVVTPEKIIVLGEIVRKLDGLPLAIELAAARVRLLPPKTLLARLDNRLKLLSDGARDLPTRQQTLRATIDWSYSFLSAPEQRLFARLGVFVGGWSLEAAENVCSLPDDPDGRLDVLEGLASLGEKSLVWRFEDEARFSMLETLREYALEKLEQSAELPALRQRHAEYCLTQCKAVHTGLRGPDHVAWLGRLNASRPNILAAMRYWLESGKPEQIGAFSRALGWSWSIHVDYSVAPLLLKALGPEHGLTGAARGWVLNAKALTDFRRGDFQPAAHAAAEAVEVFRAALDRHGEAYAHTALGMSLMPRDRAEAVHHFETSLAMARDLGETWLVMRDSSLLGWQAVLNAQLERAERAFAEAISIGLEMGELSQLAFGYLGSAGLAFVRNDPGGAQTHLKKALENARLTEVFTVMAASLEGFAAAATQHRHDLRAARLWGAADGVRKARNILPNIEQKIHATFFAPTRERLSEAALAVALEEGCAMNLEAAIQYALAPEISISEEARSVTLERNHLTDLTPRELEVLKLVANGLSNKRIAAQLGTGVYTVNDHVSRVLSKLGVPNRSAATRYAIEHELTSV